MIRGNEDDDGHDDDVVDEEILVLFASPMGKQAAQDISQQIPRQLSPEGLQKWTGASSSSSKKIPCDVTARHMQLDDFLELEEAPWTRIVVIVVSSYGSGQAPLGGKRFRDFCDYLLEQKEQQKKKKKKKTKMLEGLSFCLLGLGDSRFSAEFENPTTTHDALVGAGAKLIGTFGKADAATGNQQLGVIAHWIDGLWPSLAAAITMTDDDDNATATSLDRQQRRRRRQEERLKQMQQETMKICYRIDPAFKKKKKEEKADPDNPEHLSTLMMLFGSVFVAILAFFAQQQKLLE